MDCEQTPAASAQAQAGGGATDSCAHPTDSRASRSRSAATGSLPKLVLRGWLFWMACRSRDSSTRIFSSAAVTPVSQDSSILQTLGTFGPAAVLCSAHLVTPWQQSGMSSVVTVYAWRLLCHSPSVCGMQNMAGAELRGGCKKSILRSSNSYPTSNPCLIREGISELVGCQCGHLAWVQAASLAVSRCTSLTASSQQPLIRELLGLRPSC